jgi:MFS family permease
MTVVAVSLLGYLVATSVAAAIGLRLLFGAGEAFAFVGLITAIQDLAPEERRAEAASYFSVALYLGVAAGPPLGEWLFDGSHYDRVWWVAAGLVAVGALLGLTTPDGRTAAPPQQKGFIHPAAVLPGLALACGLTGYAGFVTFVSLYADQIGLSTAGWVFTTYAVLIVVARVFGAKIPDRIGAIRTGTGSLVAIGVGLLIVSSTPSAVALYAGVIVFSAGMAMNFPALLALVVNRSAEGDRAFAVASISVFFDLAFAVGALLMGGVVALAGERAAFAAGGLIALVGILPLRMAATPPAGQEVMLPDRSL